MPKGEWTRKKLEWQVTENGCWEVISHKPHNNGYARLNRDGKDIGAHRYMYEREVGPIPDGCYVLHHCDNRICVNPEHLFLGTITDNQRDMCEKGRCRWVVGERHGNAKLTESDVKEIRQLGIEGESPDAIAVRYGIHRKYVSVICRRKAWKHI